jgi:catechol 2,3-dioxygenase-like lactoylglutathione lyase family enzyme
VFDHVALSVSDLGAARAFYETALAVLGHGEPSEGDWFFEWQDLAVGAEDDRPVTRNVHVGLAAPSRQHVDEFWRTLTESGFDDDGPPGLREQYAPGYYGAFVLDPDGNSIEAVHKENHDSDRCVDHVWLRVRDASASRRFYETIAPALGFRPTGEGPGRASFGSDTGGFTVTEPDEGWSVRRPLTENLHLAFAAPDRATVDEFHRIAVAAGYGDNGPPGERLRYHPGYYGAFVLDPDGHNIEAVFHG